MLESEGESKVPASEEVDLLRIDKPKDGPEVAMADITEGSTIESPIWKGRAKEIQTVGDSSGVKKSSAISYKDKVIQLNGQKYSFDDEEDWMAIQRREEEEDDMEEEEPMCPYYNLPKDKCCTLGKYTNISSNKVVSKVSFSRGLTSQALLVLFTLIWTESINQRNDFCNKN